MQNTPGLTEDWTLQNKISELENVAISHDLKDNGQNFPRFY